MQKSRTINLHLLTGNPLGGKIISFSNRTILGISFSRKDFESMKSRKELLHSGVYFLIGQNENSESVVYIGQATTILNRITNHYNDTEKDFWNHLVAFTTTDNSFTETDINFLERKIIEIAKNAERYNIKNKTIGNNPLVNEFRESDLLEYIDDLKILLSSLGFQVLQEKISEEDKHEEYHAKSKDIKAYGYYTDEGFVIKKGSEGILNPPAYTGKNIMKKRKLLLSEGKTKIVNDKIVFCEDILCSSPSFAIVLVLGGSLNGWDYWLNNNGKTLNEVKRGNDL